jgi:anti-sigma regulatory factor (Ser/Thr protein kinase)
MVAKEALHNVVKHAHASEVRLGVEVLRTFFRSYFLPDWRCRDFERLTGLPSYFAAE